MTTEVAKRPKQPPANEAATVGMMLELAIKKGLSVEGLEKLVDLHERMESRLAAQEFADALAAFQAECPPIAKTSKADIVTKAGTRYSYHYAGLDEIARTIRPLLHQHGLSYSWNSQTDGEVMTVTCVLRHRNGHSESSVFACPVATASGMNEQQKHAAALTYGRRQSLIAVLGLSTAEPDTDTADPYAPISEEQVVRLEELFEGLRMSKAKFFRVLAMPEDSKLADVPVSLYPTAVNLLVMKRRAQEEKEKAQ